jgi:3-keto-L-gulonate-6-phosphate decarboxylase
MLKELPFLKYALDVTTVAALHEQAVAAAAADVNVLEVGTPAVSSLGLRTCLTSLRGLFPTLPLYADLKLMDFPFVELEVVFDHGATTASVMMGANDHVIEDALDVSNRTGLQLVFSTMGYPMPLLAERAARLLSMGCTTIVSHGSGRTSALAFQDMMNSLVVLKQIPQLHIIAAGGITSTSIEEVLPHAPIGVIVGRGISEASSIQEGVHSIVSKLRRGS